MNKTLLLIPLPGVVVGVALLALAFGNPARPVEPEPPRSNAALSARGATTEPIEAPKAPRPVVELPPPAAIEKTIPPHPGEPAPAPAPSGDGRRGITSHVVEPGQTLGEGADRYGISVESILWANGLSDPDRLSVGQRLRILPVSGVLYTVRPGDTLSQIAAAHGSDVFSIIDVNDLSDPDRLITEAELVIPGARPVGSGPAVRAETRSIQSYEVVPGDTLSAIANRFGLTLQTILRANGLREGDPLIPGQQLTVLPLTGLLHVIQAGETLSGIADRYNSSVQEIVAGNGLGQGDQIQVGAKLVIPEREGWQPPAVAVDHHVQPGDTVSGVAERYRVPAETIIRVNDLRDPFILLVGQRLKVPGAAPPTGGQVAAGPGGEYEVRPGDTLSGIADALGIAADSLIGLNGLRAPFLIQAGQKLKLPGVAARPAPPATSPAPSGQAKPKAEVVALALKYLGYPYVWGGTTPQGFDCSGFVMFVYRGSGYPMPRDLWGQLQTGARVNRNELQTGDIVFFVNTYKPGLSHNGIYVGGGRFVHAAREGVGVIVSGIDEAYWAARYYGASRPR